MVLKNADNEFSPRISPKNWLLPVLNNQNTPPATPNDGDRYRVTAVATGLWAGQENTIAVWEADARKWRFAALVEPQIWYDMTSQNWHYMSHAGVITQFDKIPLAISDVTGLQAALDAKAALLHQSQHQSGQSDALTGIIDANARIAILIATALQGTRRKINFVNGTNVTVTAVDDALNEKVDVTISSSGASAHALFDGAFNNDTLAKAPVRGSIAIGNATPKWDLLGLGLNGQIPISNGTDLVYRVLVAGDIPNITEAQVTNLPADLAAKEITANKNVANGYCPLDAGAKVPVANLPTYWQELARVNLNGGAAATLNTGVFTTKKHIRLRIKAYQQGVGMIPSLQFNGDVGAGNYNGQQSFNGAWATISGTGDIRLATSGTQTNDFDYIIEIINIAANKKSLTISASDSGGNSYIASYVWTNTVNQINQVLLKSVNGGNFGTLTEIIVEGKD